MDLGEAVTRGIEEIRKLVSDDDGRYRNGSGAERNVTTHLVRGLLRNLGWPDSSFEEEFEVFVGVPDRRRVDLALFSNPEHAPKRAGKRIPDLIVEVKKLGSDVGESSEAASHLVDKMQWAGDLEYGVTTNGTKWNLWSRELNKLELIWSVDVLESDPVLCSFNLDDFRYQTAPSFAERIVGRMEKTAVLDSAWVRLSENSDLRVKLEAEVLLRMVSETRPDLRISEEYALAYVKHRRQQPPAPIAAPTGLLIYLDEKPYPVNSARAMIRVTVKWLVDRGEMDRLTKLDKYVKWFESGAEARKYYGRSAYEISEGSHYYTKVQFDHERCEARAKLLLRECGYSESLFRRG